MEESDRRAHGKSQRHKNSKERKSRWSCEDCHEYFNDEGALMSHLSSNRHCKQVINNINYIHSAKIVSFGMWVFHNISIRKFVNFFRLHIPDYILSYELYFLGKHSNNSLHQGYTV